MARVLINLPPRAKRGEIIEIKTLIAHPMETGYRLDSQVPRSRAISSTALCAFITVTRYFGPSCSRRSPRTRSLRFSPLRPRAASSPSPGPATTARRRPRSGKSPSNEGFCCRAGRTQERLTPPIDGARFSVTARKVPKGRRLSASPCRLDWSPQPSSPPLGTLLLVAHQMRFFVPHRGAVLGDRRAQNDRFQYFRA